MTNRQLKIGNWLWLLGVLLIATAHGETVFPATHALLGQPAPVDEYTPPKLKLRSTPPLPPAEIKVGHEGWVVLNIMVDTEGKPYELGIVDSMGGSQFEQAALQWGSRLRYDPATMNGKPVDAGTMIKVSFASDHTGASKEFKLEFEKLQEIASSGDQSAADAALQALKVQNSYEDAYYGLAQYRYYLRWGNKQQQLQALRRAVAHEPLYRYLPKDLFQTATTAMFDLQIQTKDFGGALLTYESFSKEQQSDPEIQQKFSAIKAFQNSNSSYAVRDSIPKTLSWNYRLFRRHFSILVTDGQLTEVKLRCERKYLLIRYENDLDFAVPEEYGNCNIELLGSNGTEFALIQS